MYILKIFKINLLIHKKSKNRYFKLLHKHYKINLKKK
jgi:hypothetical protein